MCGIWTVGAHLRERAIPHKVGEQLAHGRDEVGQRGDARVRGLRSRDKFLEALAESVNLEIIERRVKPRKICGKVVTDRERRTELCGIFNRPETVFAWRLEQVEKRAERRERGPISLWPPRHGGASPRRVSLNRLSGSARIFRRNDGGGLNFAHLGGALIQLKFHVIRHPRPIRPGRKPLALVPSVHINGRVIHLKVGRIDTGQVVGGEGTRGRARLRGREPEPGLGVIFRGAHARDCV